MTFDPDDAAVPGSGIFGLSCPVDGSRFVVIPVPFDATTSYRGGTRHGPAAILAASHQVELHDLDFGAPWRQGIAMLPLGRGLAARVAHLNGTARRLALPIIAAGGRIEGRPRLARQLARVDAIGDEVSTLVEGAVEAQLGAGRTAAVLGGDHSTPLGAIRATARRFPGLGILHVDAHADLREAYEGFAFSHASIMHNVVTRVGRRGGIAILVQVGIRDVGEREVEMIHRHRRPTAGGPRIVTHFDAVLQRSLMAGRPFAQKAAAIVGDLPKDVYVSVDIDGLDPSLCPDTGTPVPGGLSFPQLTELLRVLAGSRRRIVGFDLNEVAPARRTPPRLWGADWNANVGARVLYKLLGAAAVTRRS